MTASALALGGIAMGASTAGAVKTPPGTITQVTSSNVSCALKAKVTLSPALKNNWVQAEHQSDPNLAVRAIPDTTYASFGNTNLNVDKVNVSKCTGTVTGNGVTSTGAPVTGLTATIIKVTTTLTQLSQGDPGEISCAKFFDLAPADPNGPAPTTYTTQMVFTKTKTNNIAPTTISGVTITGDAASAGFTLSGGTVTGSFAGGSSTASAHIDVKTVNAVLTGAPTSTALKGTGGLTKPNAVCYPKLKAKAATTTKPASASLAAPPKGFTSIKIGKSVIDGSASTITLVH